MADPFEFLGSWLGGYLIGLCLGAILNHVFGGKGV